MNYELIIGGLLIIIGCIPISLFAKKKVDGFKEPMRNGIYFIKERKIYPKLIDLLKELDDAEDLRETIFRESFEEIQSRNPNCFDDEFELNQVLPEILPEIENIIGQDFPIFKTLGNDITDLSSYIEEKNKLKNHYFSLESHIEKIGLYFAGIGAYLILLGIVEFDYNHITHLAPSIFVFLMLGILIVTHFKIFHDKKNFIGEYEEEYEEIRGIR